MPYTLPAWQDTPSTATPISSANLLLANTAIQGLDSRLGMVETGKLSTGLVNARGKLITSDNTATPTALLVGTDGQVLTADSANVNGLGLKWATPASAGGGVPTSRLIASGTGLSGGGDLTADRTLAVVGDTTTQRLEVAKNGTQVGANARKRVNLIEGANVTITAADNSGSNQLDVTIASSGGWSRAGFAVLGSAATTTGDTALSAAFDLLMIVVRISGTSSSTVPALRFNTDVGTNYSSRYLTCPVSSTTLSNVQTMSSSSARLSGNSDTNKRTIVATISNLGATTKAGCVTSYTGGGSASLAGAIDLGGGFEYGDNTSQITSVELLAIAGNLNAGSGMYIFGRNLA